MSSVCNSFCNNSFQRLAERLAFAVFRCRVVISDTSRVWERSGISLRGKLASVEELTFIYSYSQTVKTIDLKRNNAEHEYICFPRPTNRSLVIDAGNMRKERLCSLSSISDKYCSRALKKIGRMRVQQKSDRSWSSKFARSDYRTMYR